MKVYVAITDYAYDGTEIEAVTASFAEAVAAFGCPPERFKKSTEVPDAENETASWYYFPRGQTLFYIVTEFELDSNPNVE